MKLGGRLLYYGGGFIAGLIILFFFLGGKKASCDYSPTARVLKNIRIKKRAFSDQATSLMQTYTLDTADISEILDKGVVDFSKSNTNLDSCKTYYVEGSIKEKTIALFIENCNLIAKIEKMEIIK